MKWIESDDGMHWYARGGWKPRERWAYLVVPVLAVSGDVTGVRLTRMPESVPMHGAFPSEAAAVANMIEFPLGRGPGRPGGEPEALALLAMARDYAERFEAGESLPGYPRWQHAPGDREAPAFALSPGEVVRFAGEIPALEFVHEFPKPGGDAYDITYRPGGSDGCRNC